MGKPRFKEAPTVKAILDWLNGRYEPQSPPTPAFVAYWCENQDRWVLVCSSYWTYIDKEFQKDMEDIREEFKDVLSNNMVAVYLHPMWVTPLSRRDRAMPFANNKKPWVLK